MSRRTVSVAVVALVAATAVALVAFDRDAPRDLLVPDEGVWFGAWTRPTDTSEAATKQAITDLEASIGRRLAISHHFYPWNTAFPSWREPWDVESGRIPMVSWAGNDALTIVRGDHTDVIRARADAVADFGEPLFLRFMWEMEARPEAHSPADFIAAWRRVHAIFRDAGSSNAVWVWCPTAYGFETGVAQDFYPGDDYVDWICADGYNWAPGRPEATWRTWTSIYRDAYAFSVAHDKPFMAGEFGVQERAAGEKAAWFDDARRAIAREQPNTRAVVYFDEDKRYDWRVASSPTAHEAFRVWANDPAYTPMP